MPGTNTIRVANFQYLGTSVFSQNERYIPVAAIYCAAGHFDFNVAASLLPTTADNRRAFARMTSQILAEGDFLSNSQVIRLLSNFTSLYKSRFRTARSISRLASIHDNFGPLNFVKLMTDTRLIGSYLSDSILRLQSANDYELSYEAIVVSCLKGIQSFAAEVVSSSLDLDQLLDPISFSSGNLASIMATDLDGQSAIASISTLIDVLKNKSVNNYSTLLKRSVSSVRIEKNASENVALAIERIWGMIGEVARLVLEETSYVAMLPRSEKENSPEFIKLSVEDSVKFLETNDVISLVMRVAYQCITSLASNLSTDITNLVSNESNRTQGSAAFDTNDRIGVLNKDLFALSSIDLRSDKIDIKNRDSLSRYPALMKKNTKTEGIDVLLDILYSSFKYLSTDDAEYAAYLKGVSKGGIGIIAEKFFRVDSSASKFSPASNAMKIISSVNDLTKMIKLIVSTQKDADNTINGPVITKVSYLDMAFNSLSGVKAENFISTLISLDKRVNDLLNYRQSMINHYKDLGSQRQADTTKLSELLRAFASLCDSLSGADDTEIISYMEGFLESDLWKGSEASVLFAAAMTPDNGYLEVVEMVKSYVLDTASIQAFNKSAIGKLISINEGIEEVPGFEFSQGSVIEMKALGVTRVVTNSAQIESVNGIKDLMDLFGHISDISGRNKEYSDRMHLYYNAKFNMALVNKNILDNIYKGNGGQLTSPFTFSSDFKAKHLIRLGQIELAISYSLAIYKSALYSSISHYLLSYDDVLYMVEKGLELSQLSYISNYNSETVSEFVTAERSTIKTIIGQIGISEAMSAIAIERKGFPTLEIDGSSDFQYCIDRCVGIFAQKASRKALSDHLKTISALCGKIMSSGGDVRNFRDIIDVAESSYRTQLNNLSSVFKRDEDLTVDMISIFQPNSGATAVVNDTTNRTMTSADFLYGIDLNKLILESYNNTGSKDLNKILDIVLPAGLDKQMNTAPSILVQLITDQLDANFSSRTVNSDNANNRTERMILTEGPVVTALTNLAIGGNELSRYGIYGQMVSKVAYTMEGALNGVLEELGLHGDQRLSDYEVHAILMYVRSMSKYVGFPLRLTSMGSAFYTDGLFAKYTYSAKSESSLGSTEGTLSLSRKITSIRLKDIVKLSDTIINRLDDGTGEIVTLNFYIRSEEAGKLLNSDLVIFKSKEAPKLTKVIPGSGMSPFYVENNSLLFIEGSVSADIRRPLNDIQAKNIITESAHAILKVIGEKQPD